MAMPIFDIYYPFDSISGDRVVTAAQERHMWRDMFTTGCMAAGSFALTVDNGIATVGIGSCIIKGTFGAMLGNSELNIPDGVSYIAARLDTTNAVRNITLQSVTQLVQNSDDQVEIAGIYDMPLYKITSDGVQVGIIDLRTYSSTFDADKHKAAFDSVIATIQTETNAKIAALQAQFEAAISAADSANAGTYGAAGRQGFINPTFAVNQRGESSYALTIGTTYTVDRWFARVGGVATSASYIVDTVQDGQRHALRVQSQTFSGTGQAAACVGQNIENGVRTFCAGQKSFTVSFDAKASAEGVKIAVEPVQFVESGGDGASIKAKTVTLGTDWSRYSVVFFGTTTPTATQVNNVLKICFFTAWSGYGERFGDDQNQTATFYLANMQVNEGTTAQPCYVKPYANDLEDCRRYYVATGAIDLSASAQNESRQLVTSPVPLTRSVYRPDAARVVGFDRTQFRGSASVELASGGWRNGLVATKSDNSLQNPVFVVTNTDAAAVTRVEFGNVVIDAEIMD